MHTCRSPLNRCVFALTAVASASLLTACGGLDTLQTNPTEQLTSSLQNHVKNVVVIYAENRSFDNLFGNFPGADGLFDSTGKLKTFVPQKDRNGSVLSALPPAWGGVTAPGQTKVVTQAQSLNLANAPFNTATAFQTSAGVTLDATTVTRDMYHRFFENQMQINGGANDGFAAWADSGGLVMGYFDYSTSGLYKLAQANVLADHFFQGAYGGSFLNHQYLICACAPEYPNADTAAAKPTISAVDKDASGNFTYKLTAASGSPASAMDGKPTFLLSGNLTPKNYAGDNKFYGINTMQPPYQPSGNPPATSGDIKLTDPSKATTLPAQTATTIGDLLDKKNVSWKWYAGAWTTASADGQQDPAAKRQVIYAGDSNGVASTSAVDFQAHHQPFNYFAKFDPNARPAYRTAHLQDYNDLVKDAAAGTLPAVSFYKPEGIYNQHPGYANLTDGDQKITDLVAKLQASPQYKNMVIVITYDENGGAWDHAAPPKGDWLGPGTRIPAIIISPFAKKGTVDHTPYDTASVLRLVTRTFGLETLSGMKLRDDSLVKNGGKPMGDLTNALNL
jgi:acid phosphatase